jgi:hypothetical protein
MTVFDYIRSEEASYKTTRVPVSDGYEWSMPEHVRKCTLYRDSKFTSGPDDHTRPFKNIIRRIVNLQHYATGFDVKDIQPFVDNADKYHLSFLARKFHEKWARKNNIDTYIDQKVESYVDFGGALSKHGNGIAAEVVPLQTIAFCDQSDILSGPICIKHNYSPDQLRAFDGKWKNIEQVITLARDQKSDSTLTGVEARIVKTPGKFVEVYELDGTFPLAWIKEQDGEEPTEEDYTKYTRQFWMLTYYKTDDGRDQGIVLYYGKGDPDKYKFIARDPIFGRALGMSAIEELFEAQVWTNYNMIRIQGMLDVASKVIVQSADPAAATRQPISELENGEILYNGGKPYEPVNLQPSNLPLFERMIQEWGEHAQNIGSAGDAILGKNENAGDPFALQRMNAQQQSNVHEYRRGKIATSIGEEYRDWYLKDLVKEMNNEQEFLEELSLDELNYVAECVARDAEAKFRKSEIVAGRNENLNPQALGAYKDGVKQQVMQKGNRHFFKLLKNEFKRLPTDVYVNVAGKQKDLSGIAGQLMNLARMVIANPSATQTKSVAKLINQTIEYMGLDPVDFSQDQAQGGPGPKISEAINFKDLPPDGQQQLAAQAGIKIAPPQPVPSPLSPSATAPQALTAA